MGSELDDINFPNGKLPLLTNYTKVSNIYDLYEDKS